MTTTVAQVLRGKNPRVLTVSPTQDVTSLVTLLAEHRIGAVPVVDDAGKLVGIISERDIIHGMIKYREALPGQTIDKLMTRQVKTCTPNDAVVELMELMTRSRIRHVPVLENGRLTGIISIGDVVKQRLDEAQSEVEALRSYITA